MAEQRYTVSVELQGADSPIVWAREASTAGAMVALAQLIQHAESDDPFTPTTLRIAVEVSQA